MEAQRAQMKLMIVDDHRATRDVIRGIIGDLASDIRECQSGEEAVGLCETFTPDIVTMDLCMKLMDGFETTQKILARCPGATVIMVTQSNLLELQIAAQRAGASHFVSKDDLTELRCYLVGGN